MNRVAKAVTCIWLVFRAREKTYCVVAQNCICIVVVSTGWKLFSEHDDIAETRENNGINKSYEILKPWKKYNMLLNIYYKIIKWDNQKNNSLVCQ